MTSIQNRFHPNHHKNLQKVDYSLFNKVRHMPNVLSENQFCIEVLNNIYVRTNSATWKIIKYLFLYDDFIVHNDGKNLIKKQVQRYFFFKKQNGYIYFLTGSLQRVLDKYPHIVLAYNKNGYWKLDDSKLIKEEPQLHELELRDYQLAALEELLKHNRGIIVAPTGTGKSVIISCIVHKFQNYNILICAHTVDLVSQLAQKITQYCRIEPQILNGKQKPDWQVFEESSGNILVTTIQSFQKQILQDYSFYFDVVIVDECHHVCELTSQYGIALSQIVAPVRVGVTATPPTERKQFLTMEGLLGPILYKLSMDEAKEKRMIVHPRIKLHKIPYNQKINDLRTYKEVVKKGIAQNFILNMKIVELIKQIVSEGQNVLVFVQLIEHGDYIKALADREGVKSLDYINGSVVDTERNRIKHKVETTQGNAVISTTVWKEGIDIPSLNHVILGGGWKSENPVLQAIGRGLRRFNHKEFVTVHDFFNPSHHYLVSHFGERLSLYFDMGWME
jgi:superfamily II DNA or RNA helicase